MMQKIMNWFEEHEEVTAGVVMTGSVTISCGIMTLYMILWKKLGLYNK